MGSELLITFPNVSSAKQGQLVSGLKDVLDQIQGIEKTDIKKENADTQDAGTILSIVLAGPAVLLAVKAIAAWLVRNNQSGIVFKKPDGTEVLITNLASDDIPKTVDALQRALSSS